MAEEKEEILHIFVIGFHHKKGCQIEFSYPEVKSLPEKWRSLPSLAMPDGAHNYDSDAVYFHLPSLNNPVKTIFGVSCFKQIPIEKVKRKTSDMTRGAVQKAVCVLSTVPLYGYLQIKMDLVTSAFFEGDFSDVSLLQDAFHHLNGCLPVSHSQHMYDGLSVKEIIQRFRHKTLLLFKLVLLEKKIIFFHSPVKPMCCCLLSLISLFPKVLEKGLFESTCIGHAKSFKNAKEEVAVDLDHDLSRIELGENEQNHLSDDKTCNENNDELTEGTVEVVNHPEKEALRNFEGSRDYSEEVPDDTNKCDGDGISHQDLGRVRHKEDEDWQKVAEEEGKEKKAEDSDEGGVDIYFMDDYFTNLNSLENSQLSKNDQQGSGEGATVNCDLEFLSNLNLDNYGLPLSIFSSGNLCLPYVSISYLDFLASDDVHGFICGAANVLFKQKRQLADVLIELESGKIESHCPDLRRELMLTTEDLRFGEQLIKGLELDSKDGEEWFRSQFTLYLLSLLRTSLLQAGSKEIDHFNSHFVNAWKKTKNYRIWLEGSHSGIWDMNPGHPCAGNLSVADMRLRLSQVMSSSESGRRFNQAVTTTGKAVGGAIIQAKGAFTNWWSNLTTSETKAGKSVENI